MSPIFIWQIVYAQNRAHFPLLTSEVWMLILLCFMQYGDREFASDSIWPPRLIRASDPEAAEAASDESEPANALPRASNQSQRVSHLLISRLEGVKVSLNCMASRIPTPNQESGSLSEFRGFLSLIASVQLS